MSDIDQALSCLKELEEAAEFIEMTGEDFETLPPEHWFAKIKPIRQALERQREKKPEPTEEFDDFEEWLTVAHKRTSRYTERMHQDMREAWEAALERQRETEAVDMNFLRHLDSVIAGTLNYCQPKPRQDFDDDTEECGAQCLAELESIRTIVKDWLAAAPEADDET